MRWDIVQDDSRAVRVVDWKQWDRIAKALGPTTPTGPTPKQAAEWDRLMESRGYVSTDSIDVAYIRERLLPHRRKARADYKRGAGVQPLPVYVAQFADGSACRLSFYSRAGKPLDFARGYNAALVVSRGIPTGGHVEHAGKVYADPFFTGEQAAARAAKRETPAQRLAAIVRALKEGEIEAAMLLAHKESAP